MPSDSSAAKTCLSLLAQRRRHIDWAEFSARLSSHPQEVSAVEQGDGGSVTILHRVVGRRGEYHPPLRVVKQILGAYPPAVRVKNASGETPLSLACWRKAPLEVLRALLLADGSTAGIPDDAGFYPLNALWQSIANGLGGNEDYILTAFAACSEVARAEFWRKLALVLAASYRCAVVGDLSICCADDAGRSEGANPEEYILHAAAGTPWCPPSLLKLVLRHHCNQARKLDSLGRSPLVVATATKLSRTTSSSSAPFRRNSHATESDISILLKAYPPAAGSCDSAGHFPLFLALQSRRSWNEGVRDLAFAFPEALQSRDVETQLYPFMLAAAKGRGLHGAEDAASTTTLIYELLRASPHLVETAVPD